MKNNHVENWKKFSRHREKYIQERTVEMNKLKFIPAIKRINKNY